MYRKYFGLEETLVTKKEYFSINIATVCLLMMMTALYEQQWGLNSMSGYVEGCTVRYRTITMRIQPNMSIQQRGADEKLGEGRHAISASDDASDIENNDGGMWNKEILQTRFNTIKRFVGTKKVLLRHILTFSAHHISGCCSDITIHVRNSSLGVKRAHMVRNREGYLDIISGLFQTNRHYRVVTIVPRTANLRNASLYQTRDGEWMVTEIINSPINRCAKYNLLFYGIEIAPGR